MDSFLNVDTSILYEIQNVFQSEFMDFIMPRISMLGDAGIIWILIALAFLCIKRYRRCGILMLVGLLMGLLIGNVVLKHLLARPRPCWVHTDILLLIESPKDFSFPSGHTLSSFIAALIMFAHHKKLGIIALILATLIAFSRMYLFVHYPSDVLGGFLLAILIVAMIRKISNKLLLVKRLYKLMKDER